MENNRELSKNAKQIIIKLQQNEITEQAIYMNLAKRVKKQSDKEILQRIGKEEEKHSEIWSNYTNKKLKPQRFKVFIYSLLSIIFGYTFVIKIMERGEETAKNIYMELAEEVPDANQIYFDEQMHEKAIYDMLDEDRLQYVGSMVLGLNDALVELTGTLAGLSFALQNNKLVALSGLITGISATLSMASSEYLSARSDGNHTNAIKSALYTGIMYIFAVVLLVLPFLALPSNQYVQALITMIIIVALIILVFTYYISVAKDLPFKKRFLEMATISLSIAGLSFIVGILVKKFLGIDI